MVNEGWSGWKTYQWLKMNYVVTDKMAYAKVAAPKGTIGWDTYYDFVQFAVVDLKNNTTRLGEQIRTAYVPAWERGARSVGLGMDKLNNALRPLPLRESFKKYYDQGGGGIRMTMSGAPWSGQGQEARVAEFSDNQILDISDIMSAFGVMGSVSGASAPANFGQAVKYLRDAALIANDAQGLAPGKAGKSGTGSTYCRTCQGNYESQDGQMTSNPTNKPSIDTVDHH